MQEPQLPNRADLEEDLLEILAHMGGSVNFSVRGRQIEIELAKLVGLSDEVRDFASPNYHSQGNRKWRNHIQFVRDLLVKKKHLDNSRYNHWTITAAGYKRIGKLG
jgi:Mrr N-terminal domain